MSRSAQLYESDAVVIAGLAFSSVAKSTAATASGILGKAPAA